MAFTHSSISVPLCQIRPYPFSQPFSVFRFALPDYQHSPAFRVQRRYMFLIALLVACDFLRPVAPVSPGCSVATFAGVTVPETSMHKNYLPARAEHQVRFSGQILSVQSVTETHGMYKPAHSHLRLGVATSDSPHNAAALFIHQDSVAATLCMYRTRLRRTCARGSICFRRHSGSTLEVYQKKNAASLNGDGSCI